jgi:hypothetical protein
MFPSPSLEPPTLEDFQFEYNELVMGANTPYGVLLVEGLDLAEIRSGDVSWPRDHGQAMGLDLYGGRDIILDLWMKTDGTSLQHAQLALAAATIVRSDEELPLWFQLPNLPLLCIMCRPRKKPMKVETEYAAGNIGKPELHLRASDPRIYTAGEETELKPNHPATTKTLTNTGNTEMRPILVFTGPLARPTAKNEAIAGKPFITVSKAIPAEEEERNTREQTERSAKAARESAEESARVAREKLEVEVRIASEEGETATVETHEEKVAEAQEEAELAEAAAKKVKEEAKEVYISPREAREVEEKIAQAKWELTRRGTKGAREKLEEKERKEAEASEAAERETDEGEEATAKIAAEKAEKEAREEREEDEKASEIPTVAAGHQIVVDTGTPHSARYYENTTRTGPYKNVLGWFTPTSKWWDLIPGANPIVFSSYDAGATAGTLVVEWASANEL